MDAARNAKWRLRDLNRLFLQDIGFVTEKGKLPLQSEIGTDLSCGVLDLREYARIFTEKWKRPRRSAFFRSKIGTDSDFGVLDLSEHARMCREKVRTPPLLGIDLIEKQHRFVLRDLGFGWKWADLLRKSENSPAARHFLIE